MRSRRLLLLLLPAWAAVAAGSEMDDPNQHAASSPARDLCEAGHYLTADCNMGQDIGCCQCPPQSFLSHPNREVSCLPCTQCREDQEMVSDCTPTRDRRCQCKTGEYYCDPEPCPESCHHCTSCPGATLQTCSATRDAVCAAAAPAEPGPAAGSLAVSALVVSVVTFLIAIAAIAITWWGRRAASVEPGSQAPGSIQPSKVLQTTDPERGSPVQDEERARLLQEEASPSPETQTRRGPATDPNLRATVELLVEVADRGRTASEPAGHPQNWRPRLPEPAPRTPAAAAPGTPAWAEAAAGLHPLEQDHKHILRRTRPDGTSSRPRSAATVSVDSALTRSPSPMTLGGGRQTHSSIAPNIHRTTMDISLESQTFKTYTSSNATSSK